MLRERKCWWAAPPSRIAVRLYELSSIQATKYVIGTEQGSILVANKKARKPIEITHRYGADNRHLGPIYSINRNLQSSKIFMTVGDWSAKIWMDDLKTPLVRTKFHGSYLTDGCFSPTRVGAFFLTRKVLLRGYSGWTTRRLGLLLPPKRSGLLPQSVRCATNLH